jgi:hypothetical protein
MASYPTSLWLKAHLATAFMLLMPVQTGLSHERLCITNKQSWITDRDISSRLVGGHILKQFCYKTSSKASVTWKFSAMIQEIVEELVIA